MHARKHGTLLEKSIDNTFLQKFMVQNKIENGTYIEGNKFHFR